MSLSDDKYYLPSTLEPKRDEHSTDVKDREPLKNYLSSRQLPALDTLQNNYHNDDYIRIKLSGMSVGVSPNSSPRGHPQYQHEQRGSEYFPPQVEERRVFDPIRSSNQTPLIRRIMHQDPLLAQRRHSIANMDLNTRSSTNESHIYHHSQQTHQHQHHQQQQHQQQQLAGHYSAPSSPPLSNHQKLNKHTFSPYRIKSHNNNIDDDLPPPPLQQMRRNSSALVYRSNNNNLSSRRMSSSSSSSSSLNRMNQIGTFSKHHHQEEEEDEDDIIINKQQREDMEGLYSRSPELRISHKLAERKRRKEMKDLFEELKDALPVDKSMKTSKWEILSKAVEYIGMLRHRDYNMEQELVMLKHELETLKTETHTYR
ncbi:uncharacterized protein EV154DRAFT_516287 [Mucor mucedo]|uniref:uncharacterized protein n=1 Tax=Mucor mucedo TaxID=29922 RepID=UPI00221EEA22|nr:uncharacterized protein EV154DRAFT_516287 [Mucor mucedo]KAI7888898.1 hypothetical protein EV154DRAFT_516287 [Mucor mucedo]